MKPSLSALIIAKDEALDLTRCLASLKAARVVDEIVVLVDAASADETETLARAAGCVVAVRAFDDYARQRQAALELCSKDWVLWVDADEAVDEDLGHGIAAALEAPDAAAFAVRFAVNFMGRRLRFGGLGSETHVRLFRRDKARFVGGGLHESLEIAGAVGGPLQGRMEHTPYRDLSEYLRKLDRYTTLAAEKKLAAGRRFHCWQHLILPWELFKRVILRLAFLDGTAGLTWAGLSAFHHWLKYAKLKEMQERNS